PLVKMTGHAHEVVISEGIQRLGGDDFDEAILELVESRSNLQRMDSVTRDALREECVDSKEAIGPHTRRFLVDLSAVYLPPFSCAIDDIYSACAPLVDKTTRL